MNLTVGFSAIWMEQCFPSLPSGRFCVTVTSWRSQRGRGFPIPNGLNRLMIVRFSRVICSGLSRDSTVRIFSGRFEFGYFSQNACVMARENSSNRCASMVNPAACRCPPYRTKKSLHSSRSSMRLHHSGERQLATRVEDSVFIPPCQRG